MILERFFEAQSTGFYVDVGAHHPKRFSNTYTLYRRGWSGLNIDAIPGGMSEFRRTRPRDVNIEAAVASSRRELTFYVFNDPALNTFDRELAMQRIGGPWRVVQEISLTTLPLSALLDAHLPLGTKIDVLTVDVEGLDEEALRSNDWSRYRPTFVLAECLGSATMAEAHAHPLSRLLADEGYEMVAKTVNTAIFRMAPIDKVCGSDR